MTTAKQVYERQAALDEAREQAAELFEQIAAEADYRVRGDIEYLSNHPANRAARERCEALEAEVSRLQEEIGGKVYRVLDDKLEGLRDKVTKLNKRAARLGTEPIELRETDEREPGEQIVGRDAFDQPIVYRFEWVYVVLHGSTPKLNGWTFIAAIDHTGIEIDGQQANVVSRIPAATFAIRCLPGLSEQEAAAKLAAIDLNAYRFGANRCEHCKSVRQRNKTYIVANEQGETVQVGSTCVKDFVGGNDPHALARFAELLWAFAEEIEEGEPGEPGYPTSSNGFRLRTFVACASAVTRELGYRARWNDGYRNNNSTADAVLAALQSSDGAIYVPDLGRRVPLRDLVVDQDYDTADAAIKWVREEIGAKGDARTEFEHNLFVHCTPDYADSRAAGFAAYLPLAYRREFERRLTEQVKAKTAAESDYVGEIGERRKLELRVLGVIPSEGFYGVTYITKLVDSDGNRFLWFGSSELDIGATYTLTATIKAHEEDRYEGGAKTTKISNPRKIEQVTPAAV